MRVATTIAVVTFASCKAFSGDAPTFGTLLPVTSRGAILQHTGSDVIVNLASLGIQGPDLPALLQFGAVNSGAPSNWTITVRSGSETLEITSEDTRTVGVPSNEFELYVADSGNLQIHFSDSAPDLKYIASIKLLQGERAQYIFSNSDKFKLYYAVSDLSGQSTRLRLSRAIVKLEFQVKGGLTQCTGFQIALGKFLTNRHCADPDLRADHSSSTKIIFGVDDQHPTGQGFTFAKLTKLGSYAKNSTSGGLDYALLTASKVPPGFQDAVVKLDSHAEIIADQKLELYQVWSGVVGSKPGTAVAMNDQCIAGAVSSQPSRPLNDPSCAVPDFLHGCDTDGGSSGSPIFVRGTDILVGLHWGQASAIKGNCAVGINSIIKELGPEEASH